jgi:hypothetical protein
LLGGGGGGGRGVGDVMLPLQRWHHAYIVAAIGERCDFCGSCSQQSKCFRSNFARTIDFEGRSFVFSNSVSINGLISCLFLALLIMV